jgi:signal transduction histidine kinase
MNGLRPPVLDDFGLVPAIEQLIQESRAASGVDIQWSHQMTSDRLPAPLETVLYRIIQESITNALRHSGSMRIRVALIEQDDRVRAEVQDWGRGIDPERIPQERFGLQGIRERAKLFGGEAVIQSVVGKGTHITVELPNLLFYRP